MGLGLGLCPPPRTLTSTWSDERAREAGERPGEPLASLVGEPLASLVGELPGDVSIDEASAEPLWRAVDEASAEPLWRAVEALLTPPPLMPSRLHLSGLGFGFGFGLRLGFGLGLRLGLAADAETPPPVRG